MTNRERRKWRAIARELLVLHPARLRARSLGLWSAFAFGVERDATGGWRTFAASLAMSESERPYPTTSGNGRPKSK
jgi:hypothetical protein